MQASTTKIFAPKDTYGFLGQGDERKKGVRGSGHTYFGRVVWWERWEQKWWLGNDFAVVFAQNDELFEFGGGWPHCSCGFVVLDLTLLPALSDNECETRTQFSKDQLLSLHAWLRVPEVMKLENRFWWSRNAATIGWLGLGVEISLGDSKQHISRGNTTQSES